MKGIALAVGLLWGGIGTYALPTALDKVSEQQQVDSEQRKVEAIEDKYRASEQYKVIKDANQRLFKIKQGDYYE